MISSDTAFERIIEAIEPPLSQNGFSKVEEESHPESFGSRYITFGNGKEFIRLVWEGKEQWFVLESTPTSSATFLSGWAHILLRYLKSRRDEIEVVEEIAQDMKAALCDYLGIGK